ncbi:response regulator [Desulfonema magnum]|uniref:Two component system response regulator n=1 Tax=Desulfonema magnum TaxID=45655 RepID=A0A975GSQ0_9BACT|nr:response regulator [Desulfonema magnum]QTA92279.1 Two component system response regulator [Desulfonema magnum]
MKKEFEILIADRNPHVREFLRREMTAEGYHVRLAENSRQVIEWVYQHESLDLLILDPDMPDADESFLLRKLHNRIPYLPVVIHTFLSDYTSDSLNASALVEKKGNSIEHLKQVVFDILKKSEI